MEALEKSIVVTITFRLVNPKVYFIEDRFFNDKMHILHSSVSGGKMVKSYMMAMTHQYIPKTKNVETSIKWAIDKLLKVHPYCEIVKSSSKYVRKYE
ncbi:hypothetical protein [Sunxiuqinia elliptica]|uniref:Uncharacterized protein n=1 Tax=Sunxiuqinia elliptica TaxID=655355 RepID=A0A4R6GWQ0_9BACT|nr:hypothetical protein [Sunxiuqinia elliptica]TDN99959.1 hypothetical protein DET52_106172 [Sunxiuqinia elliptica]TDO57151.1 hypothetical protein DET65_3736 [Sunxiuqinia elliptica]